MCIRDRLSADYEAEQRELKERAAAIQADLSKAQEATVNAEKFMNVVRRHTSFEELDVYKRQALPRMNWTQPLCLPMRIYTAAPPS